MAHTPGPWKVDWYHNGRSAEITNGAQVGKGYRHITNALPLRDGGPCNDKGISLQCIADANLIAAAPELLEACKGMHGWLMEIIQSNCYKDALEMEGAEQVDLADVVRLMAKVEDC